MESIDSPSKSAGNILTRATLSALFMLCLVLAAPAASSALEGCYRFEIREREDGGIHEPSLGWMTSGFIRDQDSLLLVDIPFKRIANVPFEFDAGHSKFRARRDSGSSGVIDSSEDLLRLEAAGRGSVYEVENPSYIHTLSADRFLLLDRISGEERVVTVDDELRYESVVPVQGTYQRTDPRARSETIFVRALRRLAPMGQGLFAYVSARISETNDQDRWMAFAYLDTEAKSYYQFGDPVPERSTAFEYHFREFPFLAAIGDMGYILRMERDRPPRIGRVTLGDPEIQDLDRFPEGFVIPEADRPRDTMSPRFKVVKWMHQLYRRIEQHAMPLGIYAWKQRLFVLAKEAIRSGETTWYLIEVSQDDGRELNRIVLPTTAAFVVLLPGDPYFALVELSRVDLIGSFPEYGLFRSAESAVVFPEPWLNSLEPATSKNCRDIQ